METALIVGVIAVGVYLWSASHSKPKNTKHRGGYSPIPKVVPIPSPSPPVLPLSGQQLPGLFLYNATQAFEMGQIWKVWKWPSGESDGSFYYLHEHHHAYTLTSDPNAISQIEAVVHVTKTWS